MASPDRRGPERVTTAPALSLVNPLLGALTAVVLVLLALLVFTLLRPADVESGVRPDRAPTPVAPIGEPAEP